jgi:hypothetical protein
MIGAQLYQSFLGMNFSQELFMDIVRNLVGTGVFCVSLLLSSCGGNPTDIEGCGGTPPRVYLITGYDASLVRYDQPIEIGNNQLPKSLASNESPEWNTFSLELKAAYQNYQANALPVLHFSLFAQAMACSPALPAGKQKLTKISITSANDYSTAYPAGSELLPLFGAINYAVTDLGHLLINSSAPLELKLKLIEAPQNSRQNFEVQITLDDGSIYILKTGDVYFKLP